MVERSLSLRIYDALDASDRTHFDAAHQAADGLLKIYTQASRGYIDKAEIDRTVQEASTKDEKLDVLLRRMMRKKFLQRVT